MPSIISRTIRRPNLRYLAVLVGLGGLTGCNFNSVLGAAATPATGQNSSVADAPVSPSTAPSMQTSRSNPPAPPSTPPASTNGPSSDSPASPPPSTPPAGSPPASSGPPAKSENRDTPPGNTGTNPNTQGAPITSGAPNTGSSGSLPPVFVLSPPDSAPMPPVNTPGNPPAAPTGSAPASDSGPVSGTTLTQPTDGTTDSPPPADKPVVTLDNAPGNPPPGSNPVVTLDSPPANTPGSPPSNGNSTLPVTSGQNPPALPASVPETGALPLLLCLGISSLSWQQHRLKHRRHSQ